MSVAERRWDATPRVPVTELEGIRDHWVRGYFHTTHVGWDGTYKRDFDELRRRDLAVFALGNVVGRSILDVGCGTGLYSVILAKLGARVSGQDLSEESLAEAATLLASHGFSGTFKAGDATSLLFAENEFDAVICGDFVEHITREQKRAVFAEAYRVLKPGGTLVVKTPNLSYLRFSTMLKRVAAPLRGKSPFGIHIPHTRGNPDFEHHGLTSFGELSELLLGQLFHEPVFVRQPLSKAGVPERLQTLLPNLPVVWPWFNRDVIVACRKPVFVGFFP